MHFKISSLSSLHKQATGIETSDDIKLRLLGMLEEIRCILKFDVVDINNIGNEKLLENIKKDGILIYKK